MNTMVSRLLYPAALHCAGSAAGSLAALDGAGVPSGSARAHTQALSRTLDGMAEALSALQADRERLRTFDDSWEKACHIRDVLRPDMESLRACCDAFEVMSDKSFYPIPDYIDLIHRI